MKLLPFDRIPSDSTENSPRPVSRFDYGPHCFSLRQSPARFKTARLRERHGP